MFETRLIPPQHPFIDDGMHDIGHSPVAAPAAQTTATAPRMHHLAGRSREHDLRALYARQIRAMREMQAATQLTWPQMFMHRPFFTPLGMSGVILRPWIPRPTHGVLPRPFGYQASVIPWQAMHAMPTGFPVYGGQMYYTGRGWISSARPAVFPRTVSAPVTDWEKNLIRNIYLQTERKCEGSVIRFGKRSVLERTITSLREVMPRFHAFSRRELRRLVVQSFLPNERTPLPPRPANNTPIAASTPTPATIPHALSAEASASPDTDGIPDSACGGAEEAPRPVTHAVPTVATVPTVPTVPTAPRATGPAPIVSSVSENSRAQFISRWQRTAFTASETAIEIPVEYDDKSELGRIPKAHAAGQHSSFTERVDVSIPGNLRFSCMRQYVLFGMATALRQMHERRAAGYQFGVSEFQYHAMPPAPDHLPRATEAENLANAILSAGEAGLDQLAHRLLKLNAGLGWSNMKAVEAQLEANGWRFACDQHPRIADELRNADSVDVAAHQGLADLRTALLRSEREKKHSLERREAEQRTQADIAARIAQWAAEAVRRHPGNAIEARSALEQSVRDFCNRQLVGPVWTPLRKGKTVDRLVALNAPAFDAALARQPV